MSLAASTVPKHPDKDIGEIFECFTKEDTQMEKKDMERCPSSLAIRKV